MMPETASGVVAEREATEGVRRAGCRRSGHREGTDGRECEHWSEKHTSKPTSTHSNPLGIA